MSCNPQLSLTNNQIPTHHTKPIQYNHKAKILLHLKISTKCKQEPKIISPNLTPTQPHCCRSYTTTKRTNNNSQALKDKNWSRACSVEFDALTDNHTWDLVPETASQNIVGCKWLFKTKFLPNGVIDRYKVWM